MSTGQAGPRGSPGRSCGHLSSNQEKLVLREEATEPEGRVQPLLPVKKAKGPSPTSEAWSLP